MLASFDYAQIYITNISLASSSIMALLKSNFETGKKTTMELHHRQYNVKNASLESLTNSALSDIKEIQPDVLATGVYVWNESFINSIFETLHKTSNKPKYIVFGGPQITYSPKGILEKQYPYTNFFIRGYGEESLLHLLNNIQKHENNDVAQFANIDGVHVRDQPDMGIKSPYQLSSMPSPLIYPGLVNHKGTMPFLLFSKKKNIIRNKIHSLK